MPGRFARVSIRTAEERVDEYTLALEGKDRPTWTPDKRERMVKHFREKVDELASLDKKAREILRQLNIPGHRRVDFYRIVRRAWKLSKTEGLEVYKRRIKAMAEEYGIEIEVLNKVLEACGLPKIEER